MESGSHAVRCFSRSRADVARSSNGNGDDSNPPGKQPLEGEIDHPYNDQDLPPQEFLLAVMHDRRTPLSARIDAAKAVAVFMHPRLAQVTQEISGGVKIIIEGGLPNLPGTNIIMPEQSVVQAKAKTNGHGGPASPADEPKE